MPSLNGQNGKEGGPAGGAGEARVTGKAFWRSLDELENTAEFRAYVEKEFADYQPEKVLAGPTRRSFMKLMGASLALGGASAMSGCRRWPERHIAPYNERPEGRMPGVPVYYATAFEVGGVARPLLVNNYDGRPIKVEGNGDHPAAQGAADMFSQASILEMWDPERSRRVLHEGEPSNWGAFEQAVAEWNLAENGGEGLVVLAGAGGSPALASMRERLSEALPSAQWVEYEPVNRDNELAGAEQAFGQALRSHLHLDRAQVIACFDADIMGLHPDALRNARGWAQGRRPDEGQSNRLWSADPVLTVTSTNADRRVPVAARRVGVLLAALAAELGVEGAGGAGGELGEKEQTFVNELAADLRAHQGEGVVAVGPRQPAELHALAHAINAALGNHGETVTFTEEPAASGQADQIRQLASAMVDGQVRTLVVLDGNPVYDAPADADFADALQQVERTVHLGPYVNETAAACDWHLPRAHYLEAWGAARSWDGTVTIQQPQIRPLYGSRSAIQVLAMLAGEDTDGEQIVRRAVSQWVDGERAWRRALHDGLIADSALEAVEPQLNGDAAGEAVAAIGGATDAGGVELVLTPDYTIYDGRFANNGWLQELPDPITKLTWDNAAMVSPATAQELGVSHGDLVRLSVGERRMLVPVFVVPGTARGTIVVSLGYGRRRAGYIGDAVGFDAYQVRAGQTLDIHPGVEVSAIGERHTLATTQNHHAIDASGARERERRAFDDELVRRATVEQYQAYLEHDPQDQFSMVLRGYLPREQTGRPLQLFEPPTDWGRGHQWGMSIDLTKCIGCNACVVACQSENNVPIVGKAEVVRSREMHWIRVDRYFGGDPEDPEVVHQPVTCQQCDNAPCEQVCPVAATVHDTEGINVMIYNRCIGTRYCSNNCPYKVRRFNYFDWHAKPVKGGHATTLDIDWPDQRQLTQIDPIRQMQFNPDVTVRMRGVMEKCTFCTQRIKAVTIDARNKVRRGQRDVGDGDMSAPELVDGEIMPACAQTCPTEAITFGDINNPKHQVAKDRGHPRAYEILRELNTRTRLRYLARVTNPGFGRRYDFGPDTLPELREGEGEGAETEQARS